MNPSQAAILLAIFLFVSVCYFVRRRRRENLDAFIFMMGGPGSPETATDHNYKAMLSHGDKDAAIAVLHKAVVDAAITSGTVRHKDVQRLRKHGRLERLDRQSTCLAPKGACYELIETLSVKVFFNRNLQLAGIIDYHTRINEILHCLLEHKAFATSEDIAVLTIAKTLMEPEWIAGGYKLRPYPDAHFIAMWTIDSLGHEFIFDTSHRLLAIIRDHESTKEVVWELPGARQPELYQ